MAQTRNGGLVTLYLNKAKIAFAEREFRSGGFHTPSQFINALLDAAMSSAMRGRGVEGFAFQRRATAEASHDGPGLTRGDDLSDAAEPTVTVKAQLHLDPSLMPMIDHFASAYDLDRQAFLDAAFESGLTHASRILETSQPVSFGDPRDPNGSARPQHDLADGIPF